MEFVNNIISLTNKRLFQKYSLISLITVRIKTNKMKTELILKSDVLDILFENRNKDYGAYNLRKFYDNRLMKSVGVMIGLVIVLSAFTFIPKKKNFIDASNYNIPVTEMGKLKPKDKKKIAEPVIKEKTKLPPAQTQKFLTRIKIVNEKDSADKLAKDIYES